MMNFNKKINIVIPMAGMGSRFTSAGFDLPKPLILINNKPMIQMVVENLNIDAHYIFIVQKKHRDQYNLDFLLKELTSNPTIVEVDGLTEGAACTTLLAKEFMNNSSSLLLVNSDQYVKWNSLDFIYNMEIMDCDAGILTCETNNPNYSFVRLDENNNVCEVAEKNPISNLATVGMYFWKKGSDYVRFAEQMIEKNIRVNNEFYVCPVFNEAIESKFKIKTFNVEKMWCLGTPEDLEYFVKNYDFNST